MSKKIKFKMSKVTSIDLLQLMFIYLKLEGTINWNWWWVLSPLWIVTSISIVVAVVTLVVASRSENI